jgi:hypothetical protein
MNGCSQFMSLQSTYSTILPSAIVQKLFDVSFQVTLRSIDGPDPPLDAFSSRLDVIVEGLKGLATQVLQCKSYFSALQRTTGRRMAPGDSQVLGVVVASR